MKYIHRIGLPPTCGYHNCCEKQVIMLDIYLLNLTLHYQYYKEYYIFLNIIILPVCLYWKDIL